MDFNINNPLRLTGPVLISSISESLIPGAQSTDALPALTKVNNVTASTCFELQSTDKGFLPPRMTTVQRLAIPVPAVGMEVYDLTLDAKFIYNTGGWIQMAEQGAGGGPITIPAGTAAAPSLNFVGSLTTGIYSSAANTIDFTNNGVRQFSISYTVAAVNYIDVNGGATGTNPIIAALGSDANIGIDLIGKGTGIVNIKGDANNGTIALWNSANTHYTALTSLNPLGTVTYDLPDAAPLATDGGLVPLRCDSLGNMTFSADGVIIHQRTLVPSASVKSMFTSGQLVLAAPPAGSTIIIHNSLLRLKSGTAYTGGGAIQLQYGNTAHAGGILATAATMPAGLLTSTNSRIGNLLGAVPENDVASVSGLGIYIACATADFATGTGDMQIDTWFSIVPALP